jgi:hypothetical protein
MGAVSLLATGGLIADAAANTGAAKSARGGERPQIVTLLILEPRGRTSLRDVPLAGDAAGDVGAPEPEPAPQRAPAGANARDTRRSATATRVAHASGLSVTGALLRLRSNGAITPALYGRYSSEYREAVKAVKRLRGTRFTELDAVLANVEQMAASGALNASRLPAVFLTLDRNRRWWTTGPLLGADQRVSFPGSKLVWQYYPGQGIEIQWLGTFGEANGYYLSGHQDSALRELLEEAIPLAAQRAEGIAWEYLFHFDGGAPPWISGLSQGTAIQVLARAYARFHQPEYLNAAKRALGIFRTPPPTGVRLATKAGAWYVQYTYAPHDLILNGFIQALVGLYDYTKLTGDPLGARLFEAGDSEARVEVPHYDTGGWSRYDQSSESTLSYHELLTEFLVHLCERTEAGPPLAAPPPPTPSPPPSTSSSPRQGSSSTREPIAGDQIYCTTARRFKADLHSPPRISLLTRRLPTGARAGVAVSLSKVATVTLTVSRGGRVVATNTATVEAGNPKLLWNTPSAPGGYTVSLRAVDLAGNSASASGAITLTGPGGGRRAH